ncbi:MAG: rRNA ((1518)-N(6)/adenine(1519)-N(6))-dimethyltransferase [Francisellaceae bacterium]|nr:rRNA ((1518)-N(6)/adenine(1519)-N(6))-dimethyltransferase [Francisellaceae bacterium]
MKHIARKRFGQNFLQDKFIINQLINVININKDDKIIEIGPGLGALTFSMLEQIEHLYAIEIDRDLIAFLIKTIPNKQSLTIFEMDALSFDFNSIYQTGKPLRIVGNLPYNISTPLIFHLLNFAPIIQDMNFMLQKEVVDRMISLPNNKIYGRLSVMLQYFCKAQALLEIPPHAFKPAPKVYSSFVQIIPHKKLPFKAQNFDLFESIVREAFNHRRKTLQKSLHSYLKADDFKCLNLSPTARPENLSVEEFVRIANFCI